ncbi:MAG: sensor histidine kinase, partial [Acidimicrobiales bacterium]
SRLDGGDREGIERNRRIVDEELTSAETALHLLERPIDSIEDAQGLADRLRHLCGAAPIPVDLRLGRLAPPVPAEVATAVWFCCSEAVGNVVKHAGGSARATVDVSGDRERVRFSVTDDGKGFDWPLLSGTGLRNLSDRVALLGGSLDVTTRLGSGTRIVGSIPLS